MVLRFPVVRHKFTIVRYIHDFVAHEEEVLAHKGLGEEVSDVVRRGHERHAQLAVLDTFSYEIVPSLDVLRLGMMFRVVCEIDGRHVV